MSGPDVFISYNREDAAIARLYADALTEAGLTVWWDATLRSGEDYDAVTENSLRTAKAVVVLWSPRSVNSRWVRAEATIADRGRTLTPVMIEACERPVMFELKQTEELTHWRGDRHDKAWLAFVADLRRKVGASAPEADIASIAPAAPQASPAAPVSAGRSTVAVLPVGCRGGDGELELLAEDLTEDITRELAHDGRFRVIAAGSMAAWRGKPIDHKEAGRQLEARYLVEGKLQRSGKDNRLTVQLIDGSSGNVLWSTRLVANSADAELSADNMPAAIAAQLTEKIIQREQSRATTKRAPFSAWDHIFRSAASTMRGDLDGAHHAVEEARLAVAAAPDIGLAHATLAAALAALPEMQGKKPDSDQVLEIQAQTRQATRLDGNNPSVLLALSGAYMGLGEYEICLRLALRTVELWPSSPASYLVLGNAYRMLGRTGEAIAAYRKNDQLSPSSNGRNISLTCLGECLMLEGQQEAAEAEFDRALMLDPEYPLALEWKAILADQLGKGRDALGLMRQIRSAEAAVQLDQHVWQIERSAHLQDRAAPLVATLRRLWLEVDGVTAAPAATSEAAEAALPVSQESVPDSVGHATEQASAGAGSAAATALIEPAAEIARSVAAEFVAPQGLGPGGPEEPVAADPEQVSAIPLRPAKPPAARRAGGKSGRGDDGRSPETAPAGLASGDEYLISSAAAPGEPKAPSQRPAQDDGGQAAGRRQLAVPGIAVLVGVTVIAGIAGAFWFGGDESAPVAVSAAIAPTAAIAGQSPAAPGLAAAPSAVTSQPLDQAMAALISATRSSRRPGAELAALEAGRQSLAALLVRSAAAPTDAALVQQINVMAAGLAKQQGAALSADAGRWFNTQQQQAAAARSGLPPEGAAIIDRALNRARGARADVATLVANSARASDAEKSLAAARSAVVAYGKLAALSVAPAVASARAAKADAGKLQANLSRALTEIETARGEAGRLSQQVAGLAAVEKPGLFASNVRRQSFKLRKDNAERSRALSAEIDRVAAQSAAVTDPGGLSANLTRIRALKAQLAGLLAASNAALKSAKSAPEPQGKESAAATKE